MDKLPLYHGTDARILDMSDADRNAFKQDCMKAIDCLWNVFEPYYNTNINIRTIEDGVVKIVNDKKLIELQPKLRFDEDETIYYNLYEKLTMVSAWKNNNELYKYDSLYLTNSMDRAKNYAHRAYAFGEIGLIAYRLLSAAAMIGFDVCPDDESMKHVLCKIKTFAEAKREPIVLEFDDYDPEDVKMEDGSELDFSLDDDIIRHGGWSFRYTGSLAFDKAKRIYIDDDGKQIK